MHTRDGATRDDDTHAHTHHATSTHLSKRAVEVDVAADEDVADVGVLDLPEHFDAVLKLVVLAHLHPPAPTTPHPVTLPGTSTRHCQWAHGACGSVSHLSCASVQHLACAQLHTRQTLDTATRDRR
jgi:hypothetical protein